jgi:hypothetical protein
MTKQTQETKVLSRVHATKYDLAKNTCLIIINILHFCIASAMFLAKDRTPGSAALGHGDLEGPNIAPSLYLLYHLYNQRVG